MNITGALYDSLSGSASVTPQTLFIWLWIMATGSMRTVRVDFSPYDGPLAAAQLTDDFPNQGYRFELATDTAALRGFERWLSRSPLYVSAPGHRYIVWEMSADPLRPGEIRVSAFNRLLRNDEQNLATIGDGGAMLAWAFAVLEHYGLSYDPRRQGWQEDKQALIDWYHSDSHPVDWQAVADRLRATGRPVPADLLAHVAEHRPASHRTPQLMLTGIPPMITPPYTGTLADRRIEGVDLHFASLVCPFAAKGPDAERIAGLAEALEAAPIVVRAPGSDTLGYALTGGGGRVRLVRFNTALIDAALAFERSGQYPAGEDDASVLGATRFTPKTLPDGAAALRWGLAALADLGVDHPPFDYYAGEPTVPDFDALLDEWDAAAEGYDPAAARALLDEWAAAPKLTQPRPLPLADYDGPLAARRMRSAPEGGAIYYSWLTRGTKQDPLTRGLRHHPLHVRAPGQKYIVWTLRADPIGSPSIELAVQNTAAMRGGDYADVGDLGAAMAWAFAVIDHYGLPEAPMLVPAECDRATLIGFHRRHGVRAIPWDRIAEWQRRSGGAVPADLMAQPPFVEGTHARPPDAESLRMQAGVRPEDGMPLDGIPSDAIDD